MTFLAPWWLLGLALAPALLLWGLLAPRGRPVTVGSLMLWRRALAGGSAGRPTARLRLRDPLLWLDAACILFLVLACARPAFRTRRPMEPVATVVLDRTASMQMPSSGPEGLRWKDAQRLLSGALKGVGSAPVRVVHVPAPEGVVLAERMAAADLIDWYGFAPRALPASEDVWKAAATEAHRRPERPVLLLTDIEPAEPLPENVYVLATGGPTRNAGLVHVAWRGERLDEKDYREWVLVKARADADAPGSYDLAMSHAETIRGFLEPGQQVERVVPLDAAEDSDTWHASVILRIEGPSDGFLEDDRARLAASLHRPIRIRVVGDAPAALIRALRAHGNVRVTQEMPPASLRPEDVDLVVTYGCGIPSGWEGPAAVVAPPEAVGPLRPAEGTAGAEWRVVAAHPLAEALYLPPPRIDSVSAFDLSEGADVAVGTPEAPLVVTWALGQPSWLEGGGPKRLAVLFDLEDETTDWPRRASFPLFWSAAVDFLVFGSPIAGNLVVVTPGEIARKTGQPLADVLSDYASFIGTDEGFEAGPGRDDSQAAVAALRRSIERRREATFAPVWPVAAAVVVLALVVRAGVAR